MTKSEITKILAVLAASYPKFDVDDLKVQVWHEMLKDIPYDIAQVAVKKLILEKTFPPSIAEVREAVVTITSPPQVSPVEAWGEVKRAIRDFGYYREAEALESMTEITRKTVQCLGWKEICMSEDPEGVIRGQFCKMYDQVARRDKEQTIMPVTLKQAIAAIAEGQKPDIPQLKDVCRHSSTA